MSEVNEHYLDRVVAIAETATVEATEDIVSGNGIKLIAKGSRIDARARERLLEHKLRKPLESSVRVVDGVATRPMDQVAEALLQRHALLAGVCGTRTAKLVAGALHDLRMTTPIESMLSIYAATGPHKLEHAVGVSLISAALAHELPEAGAQLAQPLMLAGLMHDVGELYIDPAILNAGSQLSPAQWRHIAAHPVIASRVLKEIAGGGPRVAEAVLHHHERLDGFGYPQGAAGIAVPMSGQILGMAELLMGLMESGRSPGERASVAVKLIPGEFDRSLRDRVASAAAASLASDTAEEAMAPADSASLARRAEILGTALQTLRRERPALEASAAGAGAVLRALTAQLFDRCQRIHVAFSSTGLDVHQAVQLHAQLAQMDAKVHFEIAIVLRELEWRLREVKREAQARAEQLPGSDQLLAQHVINTLQRAMGWGSDAPQAQRCEE